MVINHRGGERRDLGHRQAPASFGIYLVSARKLPTEPALAPASMFYE
jgi:hypothetical protein